MPWETGTRNQRRKELPRLKYDQLCPLNAYKLAYRKVMRKHSWNQEDVTERKKLSPQLLHIKLQHLELLCYGLKYS